MPISLLLFLDDTAELQRTAMKNQLPVSRSLLPIERRKQRKDWALHLSGTMKGQKKVEHSKCLSGETCIQTEKD
jgi:hypothetical protein